MNWRITHQVTITVRSLLCVLHKELSQPQVCTSIPQNVIER